MRTPSSSRSFRHLLWVGVFALALHNAEEALTLPSWLATRLPQLEQQFGVSLPVDLTPAQLYVALMLATVTPAVVVLLCWRSRRRSWAMYSLMALYAAVLINAVVPHVAASIVLRGYTPGVATAAGINLPYVLYLFHRALDEHYVSRRGLGLAVLIGAALYLPVLWGLHGIAQLVM